MSTLPELLADCQDELIQSWVASYEPGASNPKEHPLAQEVRASLALLRATLEGETPLQARPDGEGDRQKTTVDALASIRAYATLHRSLLDVCAWRFVDITPAQHKALNAWVEEAVTHVIHADRHRQVEESRKVAHELRNPLGSAIMALALLRQKVKEPNETRLADTMDRNLKRLEQIIEDRLAKDHGPA